MSLELSYNVRYKLPAGNDHITHFLCTYDYQNYSVLSHLPTYWCTIQVQEAESHSLLPPKINFVQDSCHSCKKCTRWKLNDDCYILVTNAQDEARWWLLHSCNKCTRWKLDDDCYIPVSNAQDES